MDVKKAINKRRSIRKYKDKKISKKIIKELLESARMAPSAKNIQSHRYFIIDNKETIEKLAKKGAFRQPFVSTAPLIIVCCADPSEYPERTKIDDSSIHYAYIDLSIATSFLVLRATELGIGTVFVAHIYRDKIRKILNIPKNYIIPFLIAAGYPAEKPTLKPRKELSEIIIKE